VLVELHVAGLGVIEDLTLRLGAGMTALTGETGAGKTMLVEAINLLVGGRADPVLVRPGAEQASVEGRFEVPDAAGGEPGEVVLARMVPRDGRSRAYIDGRLATAGELADWGRRLVDLHGQHAHQSLLARDAQRAALDRFGDVDLAPYDEARTRLMEIEEGLAALGGDERARARELDLVRYQVEEIERAGLSDPDEDAALDTEEDRLADALAHQEAGAAALAALSPDGGAAEQAAAALAALAGRGPFEAEERRARDLVAELSDLATSVREVAESIEDDPQRLADIRDRRNLLHELQRKYGDTLADVLDEHQRLADRLQELEGWDARAEALDQQRADAQAAVADAAAAIGSQRREAAPALAAAVQANLVELAMAKARLDVEVGPDPGDEVEFLLAANPGTPLLPLAKVASGGELARAMLALRLVLTEGPPTLIFDEVDAGIGGTAALSVGRALASLGIDRQVLVVTHLPQVAAYADAQVGIRKGERDGTTVTTAAVLDDAARVVELSRMLSGTPESSTAQDHATELLLAAARERGR
jgi:DNA repair protein RecN (Recombination protein N)